MRNIKLLVTNNKDGNYRDFAPTARTKFRIKNYELYTKMSVNRMNTMCTVYKLEF
jgi:hypothetical protein